MMTTVACQNTVSRLFTQSFIQGADQRKHPSSVSLAFVRGIRWWAVNSLHKGPVKRKMFPFNDIIMAWTFLNLNPGPMNYVSFAPIYWFCFVSVCTHWQFCLCLHGQNCLKLFDRLYIRVCVCIVRDWLCGWVGGQPCVYWLCSVAEAQANWMPTPKNNICRHGTIPCNPWQ